MSAGSSVLYASWAASIGPEADETLAAAASTWARLAAGTTSSGRSRALIAGEVAAGVAAAVVVAAAPPRAPAAAPRAASTAMPRITLVFLTKGTVAHPAALT